MYFLSSGLIVFVSFHIYNLGFVRCLEGHSLPLRSSQRSWGFPSLPYLLPVFRSPYSSPCLFHSPLSQLPLLVSLPVPPSPLLVPELPLPFARVLGRVPLGAELSRLAVALTWSLSVYCLLACSRSSLRRYFGFTFCCLGLVLAFCLLSFFRSAFAYCLCPSFLFRLPFAFLLLFVRHSLVWLFVSFSSCSFCGYLCSHIYFDAHLAYF